MSDHRTSQATTRVPRFAPPLVRLDEGRVPDAAVATRYAAVRDRRLATTLTAEDIAERDGLDPLERLTCRIHRRWVHDCIAAQAHVFAVTGHRWCRRCECAATVAVDHLSWKVAVTCPSCRRTPPGPATRQIIRACRASLAASRGG